MTTFEKELRKLFDHDAIFSDTRFVGRTCYGKISDSLRIRAEFVTLGHANHYEALKVSIINRTQGVGVSPHLWVYQGKLEWYAYQPTPADFEKLADAVGNYLEVFQEPTQDMSNGMTQTMA